jgi:hypothetical protein
MVDIPITICTAQPQPRSALCFISLIKSLNLAGLLEYFAVTFSTFQSLIIVNVPITICQCAAQLQLSPDQLFVLSL